MARRVLLGIALLLLLAFASLGLSGGVRDLLQSTTFGEKAQSVTQLAYGVFALLSAVTAFWGRRWARLSRGGWIVSCTCAAGLASAVWGGTTLAVALLSGVAGAAIASLITWLLIAGGRDRVGESVAGDGGRASS